MRRTVSIDGTDVTIDVGPITVTGEVGVLRMEFGGASEGVLVGQVLSDPYVQGTMMPTGVQVIDPTAGTVADVAWPADGPAATPIVGAVGVEPDELFADVPVISAAEAPHLTRPLADLSTTPAASLNLPVASLETYTVELGGVMSTRTSDDATTIRLDANVLFTKDSADLSPDADAALTRAASQVRSSATHALDVVGHTDDVGSRGHNLDLSRRRAEAVATRLAALIDTADMDVSATGVADDEPAVDGTSEGARAANRRVEIFFTPDTPVDTGGTGTTPPEAAGPMGTGAAGVDLRHEVMGQDFHVALSEVFTLGDLLVGEVALTNTGSTEAAIVGVFAGSGYSSRGDLDPTLQASATKLTLLDGDTQVYPIDYSSPDRDYTVTPKDRKPLADRSIGFIPAGVTRTVVVVWPKISGNTVTLDSPQLSSGEGRVNRGGPPFRLTDIPVVATPAH